MKKDVKAILSIAVCATLGVVFKDIKILAIIFAVLTAGLILAWITTSTVWVYKSIKK